MSFRDSAPGNITLSITAFLGNILIVFALKRVSSLHRPSMLLLDCLAITDLCVDLITQPLFVAYIKSQEHSMLCYCISILFTRLSIILGRVSLSTLTAISVDRLLALLLGLRYRHVVTLRRLQSYVFISWFFSILTTMTYSYHARIIMYSNLFFHKHLSDASQPSSSSALPGSPRTARRRKNATENHSIQKDSIQCIVDADRISCLLSSIWHRGYFCHQRITTQFLDLALELTQSLFMLNSTLNPVLYRWKIKEIRQAVMDKFRQLPCFST